MTSVDKFEPGVRAHQPMAAQSDPRVMTELAETLRLAVPLALTQLGQIAMTTTDLAFIGRLGTETVAAASLAQTFYFVTFTFGMGLISAVSPLAAQAFGARDPRMVRRALRVGLWAAVLVAIPLVTLPFFGEAILLGLGQAPQTVHLAQENLLGLVWGILPALWFIAIRGFMSAVNRPEPVLWITIAAIPANALLVYLLLYGKAGFPELGLFGAGLATSIVNLGAFLAGLWFTAYRRPFRKYHVLGRIWRIDWALMRELMIVGAPISIALLLEYGLFGAAGLLMGLISTTALAAHQIALQIAAILFMVPLGIGMAATVRVGHALGRGDVRAVKRAGFTAIGLGAAFMAVMTVIVMAERYAIAGVFLGETTDATAEFVATLLVVASTFLVLDGTQTIANGALRGISDTRIPLMFATISYWLIGFPCAAVFGFRTALGATGVWVGLSIGTAIYAALLVTRFSLLAGRLSTR